MIDSFVTQILEQNDITQIDTIPGYLLTEVEKELFNFLKTYVDKHGKVPTKERVKKEGYGHYLTTHLSGTPVSDLAEMVLNQKRNEYFLKSFGDIEVSLDKTGKLDIGTIEKIINKLNTSSVTDKTYSYADFERKKFYTLEKPDAIYFGWDTIDNPTGGILPGEYAVLVARLGMGKSLISVYLAQKWAKEGKRVLFIPAEMTVEQTVFRLDGFLGGFNPLVFRTKKRYGHENEEVTDDELNEMFETYYKLVNMEVEKIHTKGGDILFPQKPVYNIAGIKTLIKKLQPDITIIDAVYLLPNNDGVVSSDWKVLKEISNEIKAFCVAENERIFCTTQLKRTGKEMEFTTEDIAYSDAFGQDADLVIAMHGVPAMPKKRVLNLLKVRHGSDLGGVEIEIDWKNMEIRDVDETISTSIEDDE